MLKLDLEILLSYVLKQERSFIKAHPEYLLSSAQIKKFIKLINRRLNQEPIAYLVNHKQFWDLDLYINNKVLIPRPETEILVEQALNILTRIIKSKKNINILELGTGSGAIILAIAKNIFNINNITIYATDICPDALAIAKKNAKKLKINNIKFLLSDWFTSLNNLNIKFDLIISNPPYIATQEINNCDPTIFYEPKAALFADNNGLFCLEHIIINSVKYLYTNGYLILEHGFRQKDIVMDILKQNDFTDITSITDLSGTPRALVAKNI